MGSMRMRDLPYEARLPNARLADDGHDLALTASGASERQAQLLQLRLAPDEARETPRGRRSKPRPLRSGPHYLVDLNGRFEALHGHRPERLDLDVPFGEP